jgi:hypothetical protein
MFLPLPVILKNTQTEQCLKYKGSKVQRLSTIRKYEMSFFITTEKYVK